jgi:hypothetical protein
VIEFGADALEAAPASTLDFDEFFLAYNRAAAGASKRALVDDEFIGPFTRLCSEAGIRTERRGSKLYLMDVQLASPQIEHDARRSQRRLGRMTKLPTAS